MDRRKFLAIAAAAPVAGLAAPPLKADVPRPGVSPPLGRVAYSSLNGTSVVVASPVGFKPTDALLPDEKAGTFKVRAGSLTWSVPEYDPAHERHPGCQHDYFKLPDGTEVYVSPGTADQHASKIVGQLAPRVLVGQLAPRVLVVLSGKIAKREDGNAYIDGPAVFGLIPYRPRQGT